MLLPDEIKLRILANIDIDAHNTHLVLRKVHPWFRATIVRGGLKQLLLDAEPQLRQTCPGYLVCYTCARVLSRHHFTHICHAGQRAPGCCDAMKRFCVKCGLKYRKFPPGCDFYCIDRRPLIYANEKACLHDECTRLVQGRAIGQNNRCCKEYEEPPSPPLLAGRPCFWC